MAEVNTGGGDKGGKKRSKKASTKIDMTAMVDLGFLLITFFMLTTTLSKPKAMELVMPDKEDKPDVKQPEVKCSHAITIVLGKDNKVFWYECPDDAANGVPQLNETDFSPNGIRKVLLRKGKEIGQDKFVAVIKPLDSSKYVDMVDILDEMKITDTKRYAIVEVTEDDKVLTQGL